MAQVSYGTITVSDLTDITDVYLEYAKVVDTIIDDQDIPSTTEWSKIYPDWEPGYQIWIRQVTEKEGLPTIHGTPYLDKAVGQINNSIDSFDTRLNHFWKNLNDRIHGQTYKGVEWTKPDYLKGTYTASGIDNITFDTEDSSTYGYNTFYGNGLKLRYNAIDFAALTGSSLVFYQPSTTTQGKRTMELSGNSLVFYNPNDGVTTAATLSSTGLNIVDGSITLGNTFSVNRNGILNATAGTIGGWTIDLKSLHSLEKNTWDENTDGIFIGHYESEEYVKTTDTTYNSSKTYYYITGEGTEAEYVEFTGTEFVTGTTYYELPQVFTISGGKIQYVPTEDTTVFQEKDYYSYDSVTETYNKIIPAAGVNPKVAGFYNSLGPMWYINSDGSASFGSLLVNQYGNLNVPAASITGKLTADQIEVDDLWAGNAIIGATANSETSSNTFQANFKKTIIPSTDTKIIEGKDYYSYNDTWEPISGGSLDPNINPNLETYYEYKQNQYKLTEDVIPDSSKTYYILKQDYVLITNPTGSPVNNNYYEKVEQSFISLKTEKNVYILTTDTEIKDKDYYQYHFEYVLSQDTIIDLEEKHKYYKENTEDNSHITYELIIEDDKYRLSEDTEVDSLKSYYRKDGNNYIKITTFEENTSPLAQGYYELTSPDKEGWYEKITDYELIENPNALIESQGDTPSTKDWYEIQNIYSAEILLENGDISIKSNEQDVFSTDSLESDINISDADITKRLKFGNIELIPYENGLAIRAGGASV